MMYETTQCRSIYNKRNKRLDDISVVIFINNQRRYDRVLEEVKIGKFKTGVEIGEVSNRNKLKK